VAGFLLVLLLVLGGGAAAVWYQARSTYYVGFRGDEVAIFRGQPGGVLWFDPTLEERTGIERAEVPPADRADVVDGQEFGSLSEAERYVRNLRAEIDARTSPTTTSTVPTTLPTTASTVPAPPAN
jgi:hypothetical protein